MGPARTSRQANAHRTMKHHRWQPPIIALMAFFASLALATARGAAAEAPPAAADATEAGFVTEQLTPFLTAHCVKCHAGPEPVRAVGARPG